MSIMVIPGLIQLLTYERTCRWASAACLKSFHISSLARSSARFSSLVVRHAALRLEGTHSLFSHYTNSVCVMRIGQLIWIIVFLLQLIPLLKRRGNLTETLTSHLVEFRARADEFRAKDRDLNKKLSMWAGDYERGGQCGGHTPVFRWWIFAFLSLWKVSVGIELTNGDWGRVSLSLHCGPDKEGEARGKRREQDKNTQGAVLVTVQNINIFSEKVSFITCRTDLIMLAHHQLELTEESVAI